MINNPLDYAALISFLALVIGLGAFTGIAVDLLTQVEPPRPQWRLRGGLLALLVTLYTIVGWVRMPPVFAYAVPKIEDITATALLAAVIWTATGILPILARGKRSPRRNWSRQ